MKLEGDELVFSAKSENECYLLKRPSKTSSSIEAVYTFASNNVLFSKGIQIGKQIKYSFNCPLKSHQDDSRPMYEDKLQKIVVTVPWYKNSTVLMLLGLLVLAAVGHFNTQRRHQTELSRIKGKGN
jgi:hypothetical protein